MQRVSCLATFLKKLRTSISLTAGVQVRSFLFFFKSHIIMSSPRGKTNQFRMNMIPSNLFQKLKADFDELKASVQDLSLEIKKPSSSSTQPQEGTNPNVSNSSGFLSRHHRLWGWTTKILMFQPHCLALAWTARTFLYQVIRVHSYSLRRNFKTHVLRIKQHQQSISLVLCHLTLFPFQDCLSNRF